MTPKFEIVTTKMGALSIRDNATLEIMHNPVGPWAEANALYIDQSNLRQRLTENQNTELVLFDVGLGAAANALATLHCAASLAARRPLRLVSFERDLDLLEFALQNALHFDHFKGYETAVAALLRDGRWSSDGITWELRRGDFPALIRAEATKANLVFYDPYSPKKNHDMWNRDVFQSVRATCAADGVLYTYSRATPVRVAMLTSGFFVGNGMATGAKDETTQAAVRFEDLENPLSADWLGKWQRSQTPNALGARDDDFPAVKELVLNHPQFHR